MVYRTREEMLKVLGGNLRAQRLAINMSQQIAADRSGISLKAIRNLESGENASTLSLLAYCRTLGKADWLLSVNGKQSNITDDDLLEVADRFAIGTGTRVLKEVKSALGTKQ